MPMSADRRRKIEFAEHFKRVATQFPQAEKIIVIPDNLNTHNESAFYEAFDAEEVFRLSHLFKFVYTPLSASWLNRIEIEFSAISRQCLDRRDTDEKTVETRSLSSCQRAAGKSD